MKWYFDTSVFVAAAVNTHPHYTAAIDVLKELVADGHQGLVSGHGAAEVYSVLSRSPFPNRYSIDQLMDAMQSLVFSRMELVTLTGAEYEAVVRRCAANGWIGGKIYDAIHVACALKSGCDRIYTFNTKDFLTLSPPELARKVNAPQNAIILLAPAAQLTPAPLFAPTPKAAWRTVEFFTAQINNGGTRARPT